MRHVFWFYLLRHTLKLTHRACHLSEHKGTNMSLSAPQLSVDGTRTYSTSVKTPPETNLSRIPVCLNWRSHESWWRQQQRRTSEGEGENEIFASILWQHFSWLLGWGEANVSRGLWSVLQICKCRSAEMRAAVLQLLLCMVRSFNFRALACAEHVWQGLLSHGRPARCSVSFTGKLQSRINI